MAEKKAVERRSVEFRELSTHYVASGGVKASFRYTPGSYQSRQGDWVGLFPEGATSLDQCVVKTPVGDTGKHRVCDGGLWKNADVVISGGELAPALSKGTCGLGGGGMYSLWYVRGVGGEGVKEVVMGKSNCFKICRDMSEFPSIQIKSMDDHVLVEKLRECSLHSLGSSFVMVSDNDSLREEGEHTPLRSFELTSGGLSAQSPTEDGDTAGVGGQLAVAGGTLLDIVESGETATMELEPSSPTLVWLAGEEKSKHGESEVEIVGSDVIHKAEITSLTTSQYGDTQSPHLFQDNLPSPNEPYLQQLSLSESTVLVDNISSEDAAYLKSNNKELRRKLRKLVEKIASKQLEIEKLIEELGRERQLKEEQMRQLASTESENAALEKKLVEGGSWLEQELAKNESLREKVQTLESECETVSKHGSRILQELEACEMKLQVERSERSVLEEKLARTEKDLENSRKELTHLKSRRERERSGHEVSQSKAYASKGPRHRPSDLPLKAPTSRERAHATTSKGKPQHHHPQPNPKEKQYHRHVHDSTERTELLTSTTQQTRLTVNSQTAKVPVVKGTAIRREEAQSEGGKRASQDGGLSEDRVYEITERLKGNGTTYRCPVCDKLLPARETEYSATLHVEHCLVLHGN